MCGYFLWIRCLQKGVSVCAYPCCASSVSNCTSANTTSELKRSIREPVPHVSACVVECVVLTSWVPYTRSWLGRDVLRARRQSHACLLVRDHDILTVTCPEAAHQGKTTADTADCLPRVGVIDHPFALVFETLLGSSRTIFRCCGHRHAENRFVTVPLETVMLPADCRVCAATVLANDDMSHVMFGIRCHFGRCALAMSAPG